MPLKQSDIEALVDLFGQSGWDELHLEIDGEELFLSNDSRARTACAAGAAPVAGAAALAAPPSPRAAAPTPTSSAAARPAHWVAIRAPNLGTFYRAPAPEAPPYVSIGTAVTPETEVCLIEVMKLFTTVRAGISGIVREISVHDGQMVEYESEILWIEPS